MEVTDAGIVISVSAVQPLNMFLPSSFIVSGRLTRFRAVQFMNAPQSAASPEMLPHFASVTPSEISSTAREVQL